MRLLLALLLCLAAAPTHAQERLSRYHVQVEVQPNGDLIVTETIMAEAWGEQIKRGIFRDFPTRYKSASGLNHYAAFDVISVTRDGRPEPHRTEKQANYTRLYIGDPDRLLADGIYRYEIRFRTDNQVGFFDSHDELYFNLIGTGWNFPIENASAEVILPPEAVIGEATAYLGARGSREQAYEKEVRGNRAEFVLTRSLRPNEGFTAVVTWQKGVVAPPSSNVLWDNIGTVVGALGLAGLIFYYLRQWRRVGRDPARGLVIPLFTPPHELSPVAIGYVHEKGFRGRMSGGYPFAIAVTSLAIKGYLTIEERDGDAFTLTRTQKPQGSLPAGERAILLGLLPREKDSVTVDKTYDPAIAGAQRALQAAVEKEYADDYFRTNRGVWFFGVVMAVLICVGTALLNVPLGEASVLAGMLAAFIAGGTAALYFGLRSVVLRASGGFSIRRTLRLLIALIVALALMIPLGVFSLIAADVLTWPAMLVILMTSITVCLFFWLLEAPTAAGRRLMDEIEGYMLFLSTTEWDRMKLSGGPDRLDRETFERHLPYSMALGAEKEWTAAFAASALAAGLRPEDYQPSWYHGAGGRGFSGVDAISSALSTGLASTVASASTPPSSSSGSGGGGSSGGGGGGGGGGGW